MALRWNSRLGLQRCDPFPFAPRCPTESRGPGTQRGSANPAGFAGRDGPQYPPAQPGPSTQGLPESGRPDSGLNRALDAGDFPATAPAANPVFYRTYSRQTPQGRESWGQVAERNLEGLRRLGNLNAEEVTLLRRMQMQQKALPSGRWLWIGGTEWIEQRHNFSGAYNCTSTNLVDWEAFALMMDLAMMGCGTGAIIEQRLIERLPVIRNTLIIDGVSAIGVTDGSPAPATHHPHGER
jgi:ribonucleotide reductase, class II